MEASLLMSWYVLRCAIPHYLAAITSLEGYVARSGSMPAEPDDLGRIQPPSTLGNRPLFGSLIEREPLAAAELVHPPAPRLRQAAQPVVQVAQRGGLVLAGPRHRLRCLAAPTMWPAGGRGPRMAAGVTGPTAQRAGSASWTAPQAASRSIVEW
jgi:hypothetical protein